MANISQMYILRKLVVFVVKEGFEEIILNYLLFDNIYLEQLLS